MAYLMKMLLDGMKKLVDFTWPSILWLAITLRPVIG